jgi:uncharacterized protein (DUF433 family)
MGCFVTDCSDIMLYQNKPTLQHGQDLRGLPTYTIPEAAKYLAVDSWELDYWYSGNEPILKASGIYGNGEIKLLSFWDLEEAYKVFVLHRMFGYSLQRIRKNLAKARHESGLDHPLIQEDIRVWKQGLVLVKPGHGRRKRQAIALAGFQDLVIPEVIDTWGKRIVVTRGRTEIFPWRFAKKEEINLPARDLIRPVSLSPDVMSGRLVITGTRIPVRLIQGRQLAGDSPEKIAKDYGIKVELVRNALRHIVDA